jgi:hypothetical protein
MDSETAWRHALRAKGRDWVVAELQRRPGLPGDAVYDIVFEQPYPTREFCLRWCAEEESRFIRFSRETTVALVFLLLAIVCFIGAVKSWNESPQAPRVMAAARHGLPPHNSADLQNSVPNRTSPNSDNYSQATGSLPSLCSYQTYETAECKTQK